eukprot:TRINITY_DN1438_c0_g1_i1.p1 TRINITY_DN1438_c0_g1~~TRINITY_DN1438_c0_g1_i1.p1  ORF type:complete len:226 (-),score=28.22 TRINITY_DN1438_c0_g1_i1:380-1057(-)
MVATIEHDLEDAQVLIDNIKCNLKNATNPEHSLKTASFEGSRRKSEKLQNKRLEGVHLSSKVNDKLEKMSEKPQNSRGTPKKTLKLPKVLNSSSQLTKKSLEKLEFIKARNKQNLSEKASSTIPNSLQSSANTSEFDRRDLGYNADEYMTAKQKLMTDNQKVTMISNSFRDFSISSTPLENSSETNLVSTPLLEIERLEKLADDLETTCKKQRGFCSIGQGGETD